jgi:ParB-like chromosome segregation protein Spo0J
MNDVEKIILQIKEEKDIFNKARLIQYLIKEKEIQLKNLSSKLEIKPSYLCHLIRLNKLPPLIVDGYYSKLISISHLLVISRLKDEKTMIQVYEKVLANNLTVAQTEAEVREILHQVKDKGEYLSKEKIKRFIEKIKKDFPNAKVKVIQTRIKGKIIFEIKDNVKNSSSFLEKIINKLTQ